VEFCEAFLVFIEINNNFLFFGEIVFRERENNICREIHGAISKEPKIVQLLHWFYDRERERTRFC